MKNKALRRKNQAAADRSDILLPKGRDNVTGIALNPFNSMTKAARKSSKKSGSAAIRRLLKSMEKA
jgi:hypothetical protein